MATFQKYVYQDNAGGTHPIRLSDKVAAAQATAAKTVAGNPTTSNISAYARGSTRRLGLIARGVRLSRQVAFTGGIKVYYDSFPVLVKNDLAGYQVGGTITIGGTAWTVQSTYDEKAK